MRLEREGYELVHREAVTNNSRKLQHEALHLNGEVMIEERLGRLLVHMKKIDAQAWNGEGLPPVGMVVELDKLDMGGWREVQILAHWTGDKRLCDVAIYMPLGENSPSVGQAIAECFRPIRTPEQIAAEERTKAVDEMLALDSYPNGELAGGLMSRRSFCEALYDAGIRRQAQP